MADQQEPRQPSDPQVALPPGLGQTGVRPVGSVGGPQKPPLALPVRNRERKPAKKPAPTDEEDDALEQGRSKRERRAPEWMAKDFTLEDAPEIVTEQVDKLKETLADSSGSKPPPVNPFQQRQENGRMVTWRLVDRRTMLVEMEHDGRKFQGVMLRSGPSALAGEIVEEFPKAPPAFDATTASNKRMKDQLTRTYSCALCDLPLEDSPYPGVPEEHDKVVRVAISSSWMAHVHLECGIWLPEVYEDREGRLVNLAGAVRRARSLKCAHCKERGAGLCCAFRGCQRVYHLKCAHEAECTMNPTFFSLYCPAHPPSHRGRHTQQPRSAKPASVPKQKQQKQQQQQQEEDDEGEEAQGEAEEAQGEAEEAGDGDGFGDGMVVVVDGDQQDWDEQEGEAMQQDEGDEDGQDDGQQHGTDGGADEEGAHEQEHEQDENGGP